MNDKKYDTIEIRGRISHIVKSFVASQELLENYRSSYVSACEALDVDAADRSETRINDLENSQKIEFRLIEKLIEKCEIKDDSAYNMGIIFALQRTITDHARNLVRLRTENSPAYYGYLMKFESKQSND